jgi:hypothetical protein
MKGKIIDINWKRGMVGVQTETEGLSIFEMLSDDNFQLGDEVSWEESQPLGDCIISNLTQSEKASVYFQNHWVKKDSLNRLLLY